MKHNVGWTRYVVALGALSSIIVALMLLVAAFMEAIRLVGTVFELGLGTHDATKELVIAAVEHADTVLIAAALFIIGIGIYELFVAEVSHLPDWLEITSLDDLKDKLISVVVAVLSVNFFTRVVDWSGDTSIVYFGGGIALVIAALAFYGISSKRNGKAH
ncbi:MAG TPA: YqhA family protein [Trueperaceae bacterium]|nr:YqhA family protein [Trueperaceae bacterium]